MTNLKFARCLTKRVKQYNVSNAITTNTSRFNVQKKKDVIIARVYISLNQKFVRQITKSNAVYAMRLTTREKRNVSKKKEDRTYKISTIDHFSEIRSTTTAIHHYR